MMPSSVSCHYKSLSVPPWANSKVSVVVLRRGCVLTWQYHIAKLARFCHAGRPWITKRTRNRTCRAIPAPFWPVSTIEQDVRQIRGRRRVPVACSLRVGEERQDSPSFAATSVCSGLRRVDGSFAGLLGDASPLAVALNWEGNPHRLSELASEPIGLFAMQQSPGHCLVSAW